MQSLANYGSDDEEEEQRVEPEPVDPLQERIRVYLAKVQSGMSLVGNLHAQKQFHNPQLFTKIIDEYLDNEYGTNYPPELYTPVTNTNTEKESQ
jgi:hypothetical protein